MHYALCTSIMVGVCHVVGVLTNVIHDFVIDQEYIPN
jgi:hypothetical protein